jgi:alkylated DNA repair dioxygenase AlkB
MERITLPCDSWIDYTEELPKELHLDEKGFTEFWESIPKVKGKVNVYGNKETPRYQAVFGKDYSYSKEKHEAKPITDPFLVRILEFVKNHSGKEYNGMLINLYEDGSHHIGKHSDSETQLVKGSAIYSFSYGQERPLRVESKFEEHRIEPLKILMRNNSLLIMGGKMQQYYFHSVPKTQKKIGKRINITVRLFQ